VIARIIWVAVLLAWSVAAPAGADEPLPFEVGSTFALVDHTGAPRSHADFRGQAQIVYFGYTACPNTCSTALSCWPPGALS
jgi:cytochrome oxidase Cu insertion factor (SCO1/SenC/PrrC family)